MAAHPSAPDRTVSTTSPPTTSSSTSPVEAAKRKAAYSAVAEHFSPTFTHVGIGSGSTVVYVVEAIKDALSKHADGASRCVFVPTGSQSKGLIVKAGLQPVEFDSLLESQALDVAFDGTDECDDDFNLIKGGGACLFQEKLVAVKAKKFICVAGQRPPTSSTAMRTAHPLTWLRRRRLPQRLIPSVDHLAVHPD